MGRILAIDYGVKRVGMAVTDPLQISVNGLTSLPADRAVEFLEMYLGKEDVDCVVVGQPGKPSEEFVVAISGFVNELHARFPELTVVMQDEDYTSLDAAEELVRAGIRKKDRRNKSLIDQMSASLILKQYLAQKEQQ